MKEIFKAIGAEYDQMKETWKAEANAKYPKPAGVDMYKDRERKRKVNAYETSMDKNYRITKGREHGVSSKDVEESLYQGMLHKWAK